ncbi:MAG: hypothetical protein H6822_25615 [Planctomycetaceae bacterium]|nr:hypothetical protein [Planctomycetaceae bacterium]
MVRIILLTLMFVGCSITTLSADEPDDGPLASLEGKLIGTWAGQGPCDGRIVIKADGSYQRLLYGPGGDNCSGKWALSWNALPPTLTLACEKSDSDLYAGRTKAWKLVQLDDAKFAMKYEKLRAVVFKRDKTASP